MKLLVFTDLDATLLDTDTYSWEPAAESLRLLRERGASLILVSSKTRAEMTPIHKDLGLDDPFVIENGGGIVVPKSNPVASALSRAPSSPRPTSDRDWLIYPLGVSYDELATRLKEIVAETRCELRGFSSMAREEVMERTGLGSEEAENAKKREFDEPFVPSEDVKNKQADIRAAAARRGLSVVSGGRFWHLMGHKGKGVAVSLLIDAYRKIQGDIYSIGLGDSPNDISFLETTDAPVLLGESSAFSLPDPLTDRAIIFPIGGPEGWNAAVSTLVKKLLDRHT